jgi:hypothetical protein
LAVCFAGKEVKQVITRLSDAEWSKFVGKISDSGKRSFLEQARKWVKACDNICDWGVLSGKLRKASQGKGNFGLGTGTIYESDIMGRAWVGDNFTIASDGKTMVSIDEMRQYRPPTYKPNIDKIQANFERRFPDQISKGWQGNGHLDIID